MESLAHLKGVLVSRGQNKNPNHIIPKLGRQIMVLTYFEGAMEIRRVNCHKLTLAIWDWDNKPPLTCMNVPGHRNDRFYDHMFTRVDDQPQQAHDTQLEYYMRLDGILASIMEGLKLPLIKTLDELVRREDGQKA